MKILLIGKNGQVGGELNRILPTVGEVYALDRKQLDLTVEKDIRKIIREYKPNLVINAAAYTSVDSAESESSVAMKINGIAPGIIAEEVGEVGACLIHYSTDYVFDGNKDTPYTEEDIPNPINVYGYSKLVGEEAIEKTGIPHLIFRTSWVYGLYGKNFLLTILRLAQERQELKIVDDQFGSPTWSRMIAEITAQLIQKYGLSIKNYSGLYHLSSMQHTSWYNFAQTILEIQARNQEFLCEKLVPIPSRDYPTPAKRPTFSVLSKEKFLRNFDLVISDWETQLRQVLLTNKKIV